MGSALAIRQAAAIPVLGNQICLITSRRTKQWLIPKGRMEPGMSAAEIALQEAWEEAGLQGDLQPDPVGVYEYEKWGDLHRVTVFVMHVSAALDDWPERLQRRRQWVLAADAVRRITQPDLRALVSRFLKSAPGVLGETAVALTAND